MCNGLSYESAGSWPALQLLQLLQSFSRKPYYIWKQRVLPSSFTVLIYPYPLYRKRTVTTVTSGVDLVFHLPKHLLQFLRKELQQELQQL